MMSCDCSGSGVRVLFKKDIRLSSHTNFASITSLPLDVFFVSLKLLGRKPFWVRVPLLCWLDSKVLKTLARPVVFMSTLSR